MMERTVDLWGRAFCHARWSKLNGFLFQLGARGLGIHSFLDSGEEWLIGKLAAKARSKDRFVIFDVGANRGNYAALLRRSFPRAVIHCFEPHPRTFQALAANTKELDLSLHNFGLGREPEELTLYDHSGQTDGEHASLYAGVFKTLDHTAYESVPIVLKTIDQFCPENHIQHIDFLKIDIEGHEVHCLLGASQMIAAQQIDVVQFEFNKMNVCSKAFMVDFFDALPNFELYRLLPNSLLPLKRDDTLKTNLFAYQNIVAIRHGVSLET